MREFMIDLRVGDVVDTDHGVYLLVSQEFFSSHIGSKWLCLTDDGRIIGTYNLASSRIPSSWRVIETSNSTKNDEER